MKQFVAKFWFPLVCLLLIVGGLCIGALADSTKVGTISGTPWLSSTPLPVAISSGTMSVFTVNGGTAAIASFNLSSGTLDKITSISGGTIGQVTSLSGGTLAQVTSLSGGTLGQITSLSGGTINTIPNSYSTTLGAYNVTAGTALTGVTGGTATSIPANSRTVSVWTISGTSNLLIGGGTVTLPSVPIKLDISGGTMGLQSGSGTATVGTVFGG